MHEGELADLMKALLWALDVIMTSPPGQKQRIAAAYAESQIQVACLSLENGSARRRIRMCLSVAEAYRAQNDVAAVGWVLTAIGERIAENDMPKWTKLAIVADKAVEMLHSPARRLH